MRDLQAIFEYSAQQWGKRKAEQYIDDVEAALERLKERPDLLTPEPGFHSAFTFYRENRHLIVCDAQPTSIVVLTVVHAGMHIPSRLAEIQPTLASEVEILHRKLRTGPLKKK